MSPPTTQELSHNPAVLPMYLRAALPVLPVVSALLGVRRSGGTLPDLTITRPDVPVDRDHVREYAAVCGFRPREEVPVTYPHVLAFPLHLSLMTSRQFPFPAVGLVHVHNSITQHRAVTPGEHLAVSVLARDLRPHPRGRVFDLVTRVHAGDAGDEVVWEESSTMLRRGHGDPAALQPGGQLTYVGPTGTRWRLPAGLGRSYAAVSGDHNPIHLYGLSARAFGFPRQIAHGMWSTARCLAALEGRVADTTTVETAFKKPIQLPGTVALGTRPDPAGGGYEFSLSHPGTGAPHLLGRVRS